LATVFVVFLFNIQTGYSIVNPRVQADIGLTLAQVGLIASIYNWAFAVSQPFGGALLDRLGARLVIVPAIALVTLGVYLFSIADSFGTLVLSQVILAMASCVGFVGAGYVGGQWFGKSGHDREPVKTTCSLAQLAWSLVGAAPRQDDGADRGLPQVHRSSSHPWTRSFGHREGLVSWQPAAFVE